MILSETTDQLRVLLVEDDRAVAEMYRYKLELDGYAVSLAGGETAVMMANETSPDLIFLEVPVPNLDAALALERLRLNEGTREVPVVILTDHDDVELMRHGFVLGPLDHLIDTSTLPEPMRRPRNRPALQVVPGSEAPEGSSLLTDYFSAEAFGR